MKSFPRQRIPYSQKNKTWRIDSVDYLCGMAETSDPADYERMQENYNFHNSVIDQADYQLYIDPLGLDAGKGRDFIHAFNKTHNKIQVLKGEELDRPWVYNVMDFSSSASNEVLRKKSIEVKKYLDFQITKEIELASKRIQYELSTQFGEITSKEAEQEFQKLVEQKMAEEKEIADPETVEKRFRSYKTSRESLYAKLLRHYKTMLKLKHLKNEGFFDLNITGKEAIHLTEYNGEPFVEVVNLLGLSYYKSPVRQMIHKGDWVVYKKQLSIGEVLDTFGEELKKSDVNDLEERLSLIQGTKDKIMSPGGNSSSHWDDVNLKSSLENSIKGFQLGQTGSYGQSGNEDFEDVYICYWKSWQRIGFLKTLKEDEEVIIRVSEDFVVPSEARTRKVELEPEVKVSELYWEEDGVPYSLIWRYVPQVWEGTRIGDDKYLRVRPYKYSTFSEDRPFECDLPIYGIITNSKNAPTVATMDRMKPWQRLYLIVMAKWIKLIAQDKGVVQFINELMLDPKVGIDKAMAYASELGYLPINPLAHAQGGNTVVGMIQNMKPTDAVNLSNADKLVHYTEILKYLEEEIGDAAGIPKQREGQTNKGSNVTDNQQDLKQSATISEPIFAAHDLLWEDVLNGLLKLLEKMIRNGELKHVKRFLLSDDEIGVLNISEEDGEGDMGVFIANNGMYHQVLQSLKNKSQELVQNDKITLRGLVELLSAEDLQEFKTQIDGIEADIAAREAAAQEAEGQREEKMLQLQAEMKEDEQAHEIDLETLKGANALEREYVKAMGAATIGTGDNDTDDDGTPDALEVEKFRDESRRKNKELDLKRESMINEQKKRADELKLKKEDQKIKREKLKIDARKAAAAAKKKTK